MGLSQNDPLWKLKKINGTTSSIGNFGCLLTAISFNLQKAGYDVTPDVLATNPSLFSTKEGEKDLWVGWQKIPLIYPKMSYAWGEVCSSTPAPIDKIIRELDDGFYPIIMLDYNPTTKPQIETHYIVVIAHDDKKNLKVLDVWDGAEVWLDSRYGTQDESIKILKVDTYHFEKIASDPSSWDRIKTFIEEKKADEGMVREAFGALTDKPNLEKTISDLQSALSNKQSTIDTKDGIISELTNNLNGTNATIGSYIAFIGKCAEMLNCKPDIAEITGQITVAVDNEDKYQGCLVDKKAILDKQDETIKAEIIKGTTAITKERDDLKKTNTILTDTIAKRDADIIKLKETIVALKQNTSLIAKIKKLLNLK